VSSATGDDDDDCHETRGPEKGESYIPVGVMGAPARPRVRRRRTEAFQVARHDQASAAGSVAIDGANGNAHREKKERRRRRDS
jgi:hypothetical protein